MLEWLMWRGQRGAGTERVEDSGGHAKMAMVARVTETHCMSVSRRVWGLSVATPIAAGLERLECGVEPVVRTP